MHERLFANLAGTLIRQVIRNPGIVKKVVTSDLFQTEAPRSLNGCDRLLLPKILEDFPDFDITTVKQTVEQALREKYGNEKGFILHNIVVSQYLRTGAQKTIVFQTAFATKNGVKLHQRRATLHYTYLMPKSTQVIAANCPNCGGALGYGVTQCPYCDSRVVNPMGNAWQFTQIMED